MRSRLERFGRYLRALLTNVYFWAGLALLIGLAAGFYLLFNNFLMPSYTRHEVSVTVPRVVNQPFEEAAQALRARDLRVERVSQRYNPSLPRNVVSDQNPAPNTAVKPGRRVYLTVNSGDRPMVQLPDVRGTSLREARNRLRALGLKAEDVRIDSIPSPYPNTVTRQEPEPGDSLRESAGVTLWYSQGNKEAPYVTVPDVTGLSAPEAQQALLDEKLRSVMVHAPEAEGGEESFGEQGVVRQSPEAGTRMRQGSEIRLFVREEG